MNHPRECHTGWDSLIDELERHLTYLSPNYETRQVKEKWGALRYYATYVPAEGEPNAEVAEQIFYRLIDETERRSIWHCEKCGEPGQTRCDLAWRKTLCDKHYEDQRD